MTRLLGWMFNRLPIGWLQLIHNRGRLAAAIAGIAFANLLVFFQLGFLGALGTSVMLPYQAMQADIIISGSGTKTLADGNTIPTERLHAALATPGVEAATPLFVGSTKMALADGSEATVRVLGIVPGNAAAFWTADIAVNAATIERKDTALLDSGTRMVTPAMLDTIRAEGTTFETGPRTIAIAATFSIGAGFDADGYMVVSDQTFLRMFPERQAGAPDHVLIRTAPGISAEGLMGALARKIPEAQVVIRTTDDAARVERTFQTVERPVGIIFGFGAIMGVIVGIVIVYQVLSTDVADHLREYATFKAMGYGQLFFLGIIFEEALILAISGFIPGSIVSTLLYGLLSTGTGLPLYMTSDRLIMVLIGTIVVCVLSGALATRRLAAADPADLF
jgi:putative ABC transport system permease protein